MWFYLTLCLRNLRLKNYKPQKSPATGSSSTGAVGVFAPAEIWQRVHCTRPETIIGLGFLSLFSNSWISVYTKQVLRSDPNYAPILWKPCIHPCAITLRFVWKTPVLLLHLSNFWDSSKNLLKSFVFLFRIFS